MPWNYCLRHEQTRNTKRVSFYCLKIEDDGFRGTIFKVEGGDEFLALDVV